MRPETPFPTPEAAVALIASSALRHRIADELDQMRDDLEELGSELCGDEAILHRCMGFLQKFDEMGQRSRWLATLLRADDPGDVLDEITLQSLADRLKG